MKSAKNMAIVKQLLKLKCIELGMDKEDIAAIDEMSTEADVKALIHFLFDAYGVKIAVFEPKQPQAALPEPSKYLAPGEAYDEFEVLD